MHDSQAHDIQATIDEIVANSRARFGHGLWFMEATGEGGDSGSTPAGDAATGADQGGDTPPADADQATDDGKDTKDASASDESPWSDPAKAKAEIERLRSENAKDRTTAKQKAAEDAKAELAQTIGKALGLVKDDAQEKQDPAELVTQVKAAQTIARESAAELVVWRNAGALKIDAAAVTDSRSFADAIKDLDPTDAKFEEAVKKAAQDAVKKNPKLAAAPVAGRGGAELNGGSGEQQPRAKTLEDAINKKMAG